MLSTLQQQAENLMYLHAHVHASHGGLQGLLAVLAAAGCAPVPASALCTLLQPLADEAEQAAQLLDVMLQDRQDEHR